MGPKSWGASDHVEEREAVRGGWEAFEGEEEFFVGNDGAVGSEPVVFRASVIVVVVAVVAVVVVVVVVVVAPSVATMAAVSVRMVVSVGSPGSPPPGAGVACFGVVVVPRWYPRDL